MNRFLCVEIASVAIVLLAFWCNNSYAKTLQETVSQLKILPVNYGVNSITVNHKNVVIIKGKLVTGTAWGQDHYIVMEQQKDGWQIARHEKNFLDDVIARAVPHTFEDSVASVHFLVPKSKAASKNLTALYLLTVSREYIPGKMTPVEMSLSALSNKNDELGTLYFNTLQSTTSKVKYCNSDSAAYHELQIPLPGDGKEFPCLKN